jgi:hypothetical protein
VKITIEASQIAGQATFSAAPPRLEAGNAKPGDYGKQKEFRGWPIFTSDAVPVVQAKGDYAD